MLTHLSDYQSYIHFLLNLFLDYQTILEYRLLNQDFSKALFKMISLDVDSIIFPLSSRYSHTGAPALYQMEILRSFILMAHFRVRSIPRWAKLLKNDPALAILIGCHPEHTPASSNHYDFINRCFPNVSSNNILPAHKNFTPSGTKPAKNQKLDNIPKNKVENIVNLYLDGATDDDRNESFIQSIFYKLAVEFSLNHSLIKPTDDFIASGDGTSLPVHANPFGSKICECLDFKCDCPRRYSDPDADIGWDSDLNVFYFGYSGYTISTRNPRYKIDLPLFLSLATASQHDAITSVTALAQFSSLNNRVPITYFCLDSASDNYATHEFIQALDMTPIIDINKRNSGSNIYSSHKAISSSGKPICQGGYEMKPDGRDYKRRRHKFRCPFVGKVYPCQHKDSCSKSPYGRTIYIKFDTDIKLFGSVPYRSDKWKTIYKDRTSCERMNNRIINDYQFLNLRTRGKKRLLFMMTMIGINIHLDAFYKVSKS